MKVFIVWHEDGAPLAIARSECEAWKDAFALCDYYETIADGLHCTEHEIPAPGEVGT